MCFTGDRPNSAQRRDSCLPLAPMNGTLLNNCKNWIYKVSPRPSIIGPPIAYMGDGSKMKRMSTADDLRGESKMDAVTVRDGSEETNLLLDRCRRNDPEACREFFSLYNRRIFNTAFRILGEEASAEDALQETLLNIYRGLARFRGDAKVSTWISRITVNVCLGMLRKGKNRQLIDLEDDAAKQLPAAINAQSDPLEYASLAELKSLVYDTLARMTSKQALVVRLHDLEGHTIQEIARIIRCPSGTVKSRLFYGRQEFKDIFGSLLERRLHPPMVH